MRGASGGSHRLYLHQRINFVQECVFETNPKLTLVPVVQFFPLGLSLEAALQLKLSWGYDTPQSAHDVLQQQVDVHCFQQTEWGQGKTAGNVLITEFGSPELTVWFDQPAPLVQCYLVP